jgi:anti-sigma B factor antagonist
LTSPGVPYALALYADEVDRAELALSVVPAADGAVVHAGGELDMSTTDQLSDVINGLLREGHRRIVLDLTNLTFCDSLGLGTLIVLTRAARKQQTSLVLRNPGPFLTRMLDVTGVREGLTIAEA